MSTTVPAPDNPARGSAAGPVPVLIERAELDPGVHLVHRDYGDKIRVAYDPRQGTEGAAMALLLVYVPRMVSAGCRLVYVDTPHGISAWAACELLRKVAESAAPDVARVLRQAEEIVAETGDPQAFAVWLLAALDRINAGGAR
ncbi:hypothetical protein [Streptomyces sp. YIM 98790]|uniref:hypothetical protein n=1 Tax=Streptomyces sp. YIM 98790 TaxID=2689077 RepID=UPI0014098EDC|nr:hypothetical protein [Streptomyces sp. YIM 98790]